MNIEKLELIKMICNNYNAGNKWLQSVPVEISEAFFDNPYVRSISRNEYLLMTQVFTEEERDWIDWVVFEWLENKSLKIVKDEKEFQAETIEEIIKIIFGGIAQ